MARDVADLLRRSILFSATQSYAQSCWQPAADVYRTASGWLVKFDLAGISPDQIELDISDKRLTLRGERRDGCLSECQHSYSLEINYNRFERTLEFPCCLMSSSVATEYRDGMLLVRLTEA